jgi:hypothetical protein
MLIMPGKYVYIYNISSVRLTSDSFVRSNVKTIY